MGSLSNETGIFKLIYYLSVKNYIKQNDMKVLARTTAALSETWSNFFENLILYFGKQEFTQRKDSNFVEYEYDLDFLTLKQKKWRKNILRTIEEFVLTSQKISKEEIGRASCRERE